MARYSGVIFPELVRIKGLKYVLLPRELLKLPISITMINVGLDYTCLFCMRDE